MGWKIAFNDGAASARREESHEGLFVQTAEDAMRFARFTSGCYQTSLALGLASEIDSISPEEPRSIAHCFFATFGGFRSQACVSSEGSALPIAVKCDMEHSSYRPVFMIEFPHD